MRNGEDTSEGEGDETEMTVEHEFDKNQDEDDPMTDNNGARSGCESEHEAVDMSEQSSTSSPGQPKTRTELKFLSSLSKIDPRATKQIPSVLKTTSESPNEDQSGELFVAVIQFKINKHAQYWSEFTEVRL